MSLDWKDPAALLALTRCLLKADFGLPSFHLPSGHLCPPVPQRLSYVRWVAALLEEQGPQGHRGRRGVDVGCGASCIFPLLSVRCFGHDFVATDCDAAALRSAQRNVRDNGLGDKVPPPHQRIRRGAALALRTSVADL